MTQKTAGEGLPGVLRDARAVFLVGVPPEQRGDAGRALRDFLVRAQADGYRIGFQDGQATAKIKHLDERLGEDTPSCRCGSTTPAQCVVRCEKDDL